MSIHAIGLVLFGLYLLIMIAVGIVSARYQKTSADFWVAGRSIGLPVLVIANVAAIMHGGSILSGVALSASIGGVAELPYLGFVGGTAIIFFFFAKKLRNSRGFTLPDYMGDRFDSRFLRGFSAIVVAVSSVIYLIAQIRVMGFILEELIGVDFYTGMALGTAVFVFYVAIGGLLAVVWTNIAQFAFMWVGLVVMAPYLYERVGGWYSVIEQVEAIAPGWSSPQGTTWSLSFLVSWQIIWFVAYCTRLELITKMYAARDDSVARRCLPWSILLVMIFLLYGNFYIGGAARILVWDSIATPDQAFPALVTMILPPLLAAFALTGIASAAMSTTDSLLLMSGAAVAHDLLRKCVHEPRGIQKDESYYLRASRWTILIVGIVAFVGAIPDVDLILQIVSYAVAILGSTFFFPLIVGLISKSVSKEAAIASSVGGALVCCIWTWARLAGAAWAQELHPGVIGLAVSAALMFAVARMTTPLEGDAVTKFFPEKA
jgi:SSS family transporter